MSLFEYGIQNEESDIRIHVCPRIKRLYLYDTSAGVGAIKTNEYRLMPAYQFVNGERIVTANGYVVPYGDINGCRELSLPDSIWAAFPVYETDTTSKKGIQATSIVQSGFEQGCITLPINVTSISDVRVQIKGTDMLLALNLRLQVKCDLKGGNKSLGGTGNLYLQTAEINPYKAR